MDSSILARQDRVHLDNGMDLRLLSALEGLQARREAGELACEDRERALCSNACLLARALERTENHTPVVLDKSPCPCCQVVEEAGAVILKLKACSIRRSDPGLDVSQTELEELKKNFAGPPLNGSDGGC